jgi:hypothetical protein
MNTGQAMDGRIEEKTTAVLSAKSQAGLAGITGQ